MRFTFKNKISEENGIPEAVFDMWQLQGFSWNKKRENMGEVTMDSTHLKQYCDCFSRGGNPGGGCYAPESEDLEEFKKALKAVDGAWKMRG